MRIGPFQPQSFARSIRQNADGVAKSLRDQGQQAIQQAARGARQTARNVESAARAEVGRVERAASGPIAAAVGVANAVVSVTVATASAAATAIGAAIGAGRAVATSVARAGNDLLFVQGPELRDLSRRAAAANEGPPAERKHGSRAEVREYGELSNAIYADTVPEGWSEVKDAEQRLGVPLRDPETGLEAKIYESDDGRFVLVFEGTTATELADWETNLPNGFGGVPKQYRQGLDIALRFKEEFGDEGDLVITGHSLGGGIATFAGVGAGMETYTFNPSGLGPGSRAWLESQGLIDRNEHLVQNFVQNGEILDGLRHAQYAAMPIFSALTGGSLQMIGEVERVGDWDRPPVTSHNHLDLDAI